MTARTKNTRNAIWISEFWKKVISSSAEELGISAGKFVAITVYDYLLRHPRLLRLAEARAGWRGEAKKIEELSR